jgi:hypothetical protein
LRVIAEARQNTPAGKSGKRDIVAEEPSLCRPTYQTGTAGRRLAAWLRDKHRLLLCVPAAIAVLIATLRFAGSVPGPGLDLSWCQALTYFYKHNYQAGTDYLFTYGPLGFLATCLYDPDIFWLGFAWEVAMKAILAASFVVLWMRLPGRGLPAASLIVFLAVAPLFMADSLYEFLIIAATLLAISSRRLSLVWLFALIVVLVLLSLTKFTLALLSLLAVFSVCMSRLEERPRWRTLTPALLMLLLWPAAWLLLGQNLTNLPDFIRGSLQIAGGYPQGMAYAGDRSDIRLAKLIVVLLAASAVAGRHAWTPRSLSAALFMTGACFMAWRHAVIRHDAPHASDFFGCALLIAILLPASLPTIDWRAPYRIVAVAYAGLLCCIGLMNAARQPWDLRTYWPLVKIAYAANGDSLAHPAQLERALRAQLGPPPATCHLPRIADRVGGSTIDEMSNEPALVLLNHMNYRPRPVLQSYSAYTDYLLKANADFLASDRAPEYVLFDLQTGDMHLPATEDGPALLEVFHRYRPVMVEKSRILLERRSAEVGELVRQKVVSLPIRFNQAVLLPAGGRQVLSLQIRETRLGACRRLLLRPEPVMLNILTSDGRTIPYRLIPGTAGSGFLINPLVEKTEDLLHLYGGQPGRRAVAFSVTSKSKTAYRPELTMTVESVSNLIPQTLTARQIEELQWPNGANKGLGPLASVSVPLVERAKTIR